MKLKAITPGMVIHCPKEEDARALLKHLDSLGHRRRNGDRLTGTSLGQHWRYGEETVYLVEGGIVSQDRMKLHSDITEFSDLIELDDFNAPNTSSSALDDKSNTQMSAVEVLKWFANTDSDIVYKIFKCWNIDDIVNEYEPQEVVDKITACEATKKAPKPVEVEWVDVCRIYDKDSGVYITEYEFKENEKILKTEEALRSYIEGRNGEYYAVIERRCQVKEDK